MKQRIMFLFAALVLCMPVCFAKDLKKAVFTVEPKMVCGNCENKIVEGLRFEKGIKDVVTDLKDQTVTVTYDADKTNEDEIIKSFSKIDYKAKAVDCNTGCSTKADTQQCESKCCGEKKCPKK